MEKKYDFSGWATRNDLKCSDGRIIRKDAFKHYDGRNVPMVWNHDHTDPYRIVGNVLLKNRNEGLYAYGSFNDTDLGQTAKTYVMHGDITQLSLHANKVSQQGPNVIHGDVVEVSLVIKGANPGAYIENVMMHGDEVEDEIIIYTGEDISLYHSDEEELRHADDKKEDDKQEEKTEKSDKTIQDVIDTMNDEQKDVLYTLVGMAAGAGDDAKKENDDVKHSEGGDNTMKRNVFDQEEKQQNGVVLTHADQVAILDLAKTSAVGSLKAAMEIYADTHSDTFKHGIDDIEQLFPEYKDVHPGAPELIERDQSWIGSVVKKARKSPITRIRTRQADARANELRAKGYNNREEQKKLSGNLKLIMRTTDPQTVYRRDELHRDDILDINDFDVVAYQKTVMRHNMEEEIALAALIGDGREDTDPDKIHESHIRSIWNDDDLYTIHYDIDIAAAKAELQGTNTSANFGDNYIRAEAMVTASLYSREKYKGKGQVDLYIEPHELNVMLLARDLNGRRLYDSKEDLARALNVGEVHTVEQFAGKTRTTADGKTKKLLGLFVNMSNYQFGCTKGGELTNFEDFDIDFNKYKYLMETRLSGALTEIYSAIALEEDVTE